MLVLTRKKDESIHIGDDIKVMVVEVQGNKVKIGISAPADMKITRNEHWTTNEIPGHHNNGDDSLEY